MLYFTTTYSIIFWRALSGRESMLSLLSAKTFYHESMLVFVKFFFLPLSGLSYDFCYYIHFFIKVSLNPISRIYLTYFWCVIPFTYSWILLSSILFIAFISYWRGNLFFRVFFLGGVIFLSGFGIWVMLCHKRSWAVFYLSIFWNKQLCVWISIMSFLSVS